MYIPEFARMEDVEEQRDFLRRQSFGILFSWASDTQPWVSHLPMLLREDVGTMGVLTGHMAVVNQQWRDLDNHPVLAVFPGPHAYISPNWYEVMTVPTWNYVAVHVYGTFRLTEGDVALADMEDMVRLYEPDSPLLDLLQEPVYQAHRKGVAGFRIEVERIEGKKKLSQNKTPATRTRVIEALRSDRRDAAQEVADWMERTLREER
ncbi:MAG: FMN-binding negative transcriptional regulator [Thermaerobacter sp.]|nr:FMN-binding negative transcriptional regulator [Thermaerobacter sp.]